MSVESKPVLELPTAIGERHYTVDEIAEAWKLSRDKVRRLFENEPGVLVLENRGAFSKRRYRTLRIPESVAERVYRRLLKR
ncbi:hypothetical protein MYX77_10675 [Acidobacteriia bacterium AH_259_A11_L15]|nr:hypothetical protein [Acidobacteriia bacterium AH_259_A11_L15]